MQGYTEKSYYDNTKYTGVVATNDPINEGYFKHLVNFDISDTGQSLTPRKGFLTTTLVHGGQLVSLSDSTIIFKDNNIQECVVYDFKNHKGYTVDIDAYNLNNKLIPTTRAIAYLDWDDVLDFLLQEVAPIQDEMTEIRLSVPTEEEARILLLEHTLANLELLKDTKIERIVDTNMVYKTLIKVKYATNYPFILEMYYRKDATTILDTTYPANTLVFGVVDVVNHPTYDVNERNIASPKSIIPPVMQNLYTESTRPAGFVSELGGALYVSNLDLSQYYINYVRRNGDYLVRPYFNLNPAYVELNEDSSVTCKWAYRVDITSMHPNNKYPIYRSPWMNYTSRSAEPTNIFTPSLSTSDLTNANKSLRHFRSTSHIIFVVPRSYYSTVTTIPMNSSDVNIPQPDAASTTALQGVVASWNSIISTIDSPESLKNAILTLSDSALFYVYNLRAPNESEATNIYRPASAFESSGTNYLVYATTNNYTIERTSSTDLNYEGLFLTGTQVVDLITKGNILDTEGVTFRLLPYAARDTYNPYAGTNKYRWVFAPLQYHGWANMGTVEDYPSSVSKYSIYSGLLTSYKFCYSEDGEYIIGDRTNTLLNGLGLNADERNEFFKYGFTITFYLRPYKASDIEPVSSLHECATVSQIWNVSSYATSSVQVLYSYDSFPITTIPQTLTKEPADIAAARHFIVFNNDQLVVWNNNVLYISEPGAPYYFKEASKIELGERIVKALQFKTVLLVFTTQHLYAVYQSELLTPSVADPKVQESTIIWTQQIVLYNIMASDRYADVIQVFNQMVLFYSEDGQLFMIKPNTVIDSETRFTLQYFNKSANDILANYDVYINERLAEYNIQEQITKDQVQIKALLSINTIKIFYCVPGYLTYVLIYDVINNRYTVYDSLTFTDISDKMYTESGETYLTNYDGKTYFTFDYVEPNQEDSMCDMSITNNFKRIAVSALIDTGNLNLNNHLYKRFRDLYIVFKNLSASKLLFNIETVVDDVVSHPYYVTQLQVQDIGGTSYYVTIPRANKNDIVDLIDINQVSEVASSAFLYALNHNLFEERNTLMDFAGYTSSKLLTHKTSIVSMGKVFRLKMQFISKGKYKIQNFGIVYKERRI